MRDAEIMKILAQETEEMNFASPIHQDKVFVIMWQSSKSGGTYTELRKTEKGKIKFLQGLSFMGVDLNEVYVIETSKKWVPVKKSKTKKNTAKERNKAWLNGDNHIHQKKMH